MTATWTYPCLSLLLAIASSQARAQSGESPPRAGDARVPEARAGAKEADNWRGRGVYERYCISCHGADGDGRGPSSHHLDSIATNFTSGVYKCRSTPTGSLPTDEDIARSLSDGLPGTAMPPFNTLGPLEQEEVRDTLKAFSNRFAQEAPKAPLAIPTEPALGAESVARGLALYQGLKCTVCHGDRGHGAPGGMNLRDDDGNPARVTDLGIRHSFKCGETDPDVYRTLMTGLDGTPMSSYAETLTPEQAWDLIHYLKSLRP